MLRWFITPTLTTSGLSFFISTPTLLSVMFLFLSFKWQICHLLTRIFTYFYDCCDRNTMKSNSAFWSFHSHCVSWFSFTIPFLLCSLILSSFPSTPALHMFFLNILPALMLSPLFSPLYTSCLHPLPFPWFSYSTTVSHLAFRLPSILGPSVLRYLCL